jgi:hypothetical protein
MRYLLAAEADKIQDFIFRSSRLREVVGASQLLTRFCEEGAGPLLRDKYGGDSDQDIVVNDGGSFRVIFEDADKARQFGADLAELFRLTVDGALSVAEPVPIDGRFKDANKAADKALRRAKNHRVGAVAEPHMPYVAFCASCGVALAEKHGRLADELETVRPRYLCIACQTKARERHSNQYTLLGEFREAVVGRAALDEFDSPGDADSVGAYDDRNYVAYLVADGNNMGKLFGACDSPGQIAQFSTGLTPATRRSLAAPTLLTVNWALPKQERLIPVLPLILGGDDLFALIPAPYALDFARRFCLAYEDKLKALVEKPEVGLTIGGEGIERPTVAAAVVICKSKYPYALAHRRAEELLKEAKRHCKLLAAETGERLSAVNFAVILGNRLAGLEDEDEKLRAVRLRTLRPYWVGQPGARLPTEAQKRGVDLLTLIDLRRTLKDVPHKRLVELRRLFERLLSEMDVNHRELKLKQSAADFRPWLKRSGHEDALTKALEDLGKPLKSGGGEHYWRELERGFKSPWPVAHGMLDLLEAWDFAQDLTKAPADYEAEESER